jgi:hypothetical protein
MALPVLSKAGIMYADRVKKAANKVAPKPANPAPAQQAAPTVKPLISQQLSDPKVTRAYIIANALAAFGTMIPMKAHTPKGVIVAAYNKVSHNAAILGRAASHARQVNHTDPPKTKPSMSTWTIRRKSGHEGLGFQCPFGGDAHQLTLHMQTAL